MNNPLENKQNKPRYEIIYEDIKEKIHSQYYKIGERIPSEKELTGFYNVSRITTKKALDQLVIEGVIERTPGKGSFVVDKTKKKNRQHLSKKGYLLGFVFPELDENHMIELFKALEKAASSYSSSIVVKQTFGDGDLEKEAIISLLELGVDGIIILPVTGAYFNEEVLKLNIEKFPHVLVDRYFKGIHSTSICTDNVKASKEAVHYLFDLNHQQIAIFSPPYKDISAIEDRIDGFIQAYAERGVMVNKDIWLTDIVSELPNSQKDPELIKKDIEKMKEHLQKHKEITTIFAMHYNIALLARVAADELNLSVPEDLSIICFDGPKKFIEQIPFTHIKQDQQQMGEKAIEAIISLIEKKEYPEKTILKTVLVEGKSVKKKDLKKAKLN